MTGLETPSYPWEVLAKREECCVEKKVLLNVKNLKLSYGDKPVLDGVNININQGCITALVGPSGCGKTSFLYSLNRLIEKVPDAKVEGQIELAGQNLFAKDVNLQFLRSRVGLIFQKPNPFPLSIRKNITVTLAEHGIRDHEEQEHILEKALKSVGLWNEVHNRLDKSALSLSGGQQQRLCIARALVLRPQVLLMDEPCSALDPISSGVVEDLISDLRGRYTVIVITHNLAQARRIADYVGVFWVHENVGKLIEFGTTREIFETPKMSTTRAYVGGIRG